jgi:hypothetical protein
MNKDVMCPTGAATDRATARLGSSLHVKGEISGNEDLYMTEQLKDWSISMSGS